MADIDRYLQDIKDAKYGRDVRDSIHDGIEAINNEVEAAHEEMDAFVQGNMDTALTSTVLPAQGKAVGDAIAAAKTAVEGELSAAEGSIATDITRAESAAKAYADTRVDGLHDQTLAAFDQYEQGNRGIFKDITLGWYYALDGQTVPYEGWGITKQIPVKPGDVVHYKSPVSSEYNMFYDSTYSKVAGSGFTTSGTGSVIAPEGAAYVGFSNTEAGIKQLDVWLDGTAKIEQDVAELKSDLTKYGLSDTVKSALLACFRNVAWANEMGNVYYSTLSSAIYANEFPRLEATYTGETAIIYTDDSLEAIKQYIAVKYYENVNDHGTVIPNNSYSLTGVLQEGDSTLIVSYLGKNATVIVPNVVDFYNIFEWSKDAGNLLVIPGAASYGNDTIYISDGTEPLVKNRRSVVVAKGVLPFMGYDQTTPTQYYPIPIPSSATKCTITISPNTMFSGPRVVVYNKTTNKYENKTNIGWASSGSSFTFDAGENQFLSVNGKYDSAGSEYITEPSNIAIKFE